MDRDERIIGRLEEFKDFAKAEFHDIKSQLKDLQGFRLKALGAAGIIAFITSIVVELIRS